VTAPAAPEGVVRFAIARQDVALDRTRFAAAARTLGAWRRVLARLGLVGRHPARYDGYGYGNLSARVPPWAAAAGARAFLITGTQTGARPTLALADYALVRRYDIAANSVVCRGRCLPSSESLTHAALYDLDPRWRFVFHAHSPEIWGAARRLGLGATAPGAECGTPEMAREVARLAREGRLARRVFAMRGHRDGVVAFGETAEEAGLALVRCLAQA
jgi:ribulose-5-phosphate 4-epimerase/fuculose-1-phosphate aldolase